jgi:hypothetical protein
VVQKIKLRFNRKEINFRRSCARNLRIFQKHNILLAAQLAKAGIEPAPVPDESLKNKANKLKTMTTAMNAIRLGGGKTLKERLAMAATASLCPTTAAKSAAAKADATKAGATKAGAQAGAQAGAPPPVAHEIQVTDVQLQPDKLMACPRCGKVVREALYPKHAERCGHDFGTSYSEMATNMWANVDESDSPPAKPHSQPLQIAQPLQTVQPLQIAQPLQTVQPLQIVQPGEVVQPSPANLTREVEKWEEVETSKFFV